MSTKLFYTLFAILLAATIVFWGFMFQDRSSQYSQDSVSDPGNITITMYHGEGCACCVRWADYLEEQGFTVVDELLENPHSIKNEHEIPGMLRSCHTAVVDGYIVEGHVPAEDIIRLLQERPDATGISVPGMPPNAPGMDMPVDREFSTILFKGDDMSVFNTHR